jgi:hypothetical protein
MLCQEETEETEDSRYFRFRGLFKTVEKYEQALPIMDYVSKV